MSGFDAFIELFGSVTILDVVWFVLAVVFIVTIFVQGFRLLSRKIKEHDKQVQELNETIEVSKHYPEYREQSRKIQEGFQQEIDGLKNLYLALEQKVDRQEQHLNKIEESNMKRERNKIRDILLQYYKTYGTPENNPTCSWKRIESETFWELFRDYEELNGDGLIHDTVEPAMRLLNIID